MDEIATTVDTIVGEVLNQIVGIRDELIEDPSPGTSEKEHYEYYAKQLEEVANLLKTAAYFAQG